MPNPTNEKAPKGLRKIVPQAENAESMLDDHQLDGSGFDAMGAACMPPPNQGDQALNFLEGKFKRRPFAKGQSTTSCHPAANQVWLDRKAHFPPVKPPGFSRKFSKENKKEESEAQHESPTGIPDLSTGHFLPKGAQAAAIRAAGPEGLDIQVRLGTLASGTIRMRSKGKHFVTHDARFCKLNWKNSMLAPLAALGVPVVVVQIGEQGKVAGHASMWTNGVLISREKMEQLFPKNLSAFKWEGLTGVGAPASVTNEVTGGQLDFILRGIPVTIAGVADGMLDFGVQRNQQHFHATAELNLPKLNKARFEVFKDKRGRVTGRGEMGVAVDGFKGNAIAELKAGKLNVGGRVRYEKGIFSGEVEIFVGDKQLADSFVRDQLSADQLHDSTDAAKLQKMSADEVGFAARGEVHVALAKGLDATAQVGIDGQGKATMQGKINAPEQVELFPAREQTFAFPSLYARTLYGIPAVGNVFVAASLGLELFATLGPAVLRDIQIEGTFSDDESVRNSLIVEGALQMNAAAGARLNASAKAGLEILDHEFSVNLNLAAEAGIQAYVEAAPTIGYRETSPDTPGELYFKGHLEAAGRPYFGLRGDAGFELDAPWWSPAPDEKWTWPMFGLSYPLPGGFGIGADVEHVIGSGKVPEVSFGAVDFSADKFMHDLMNQDMPKGKKKKDAAKAKFEDGAGKGEQKKPNLKSTLPVPVTDKQAGPVAGLEEKRRKALREREKESVTTEKKGKTEKKTDKKESMGDKKSRLQAALQESGELARHPQYSFADIRKKLQPIQEKYGLKYLRLVVIKDTDELDEIKFEGKVNPEDETKTLIKISEDVHEELQGLQVVLQTLQAAVDSSGKKTYMRLPEFEGIKDNTTSLSIPREVPNQLLHASDKLAKAQKLIDTALNRKRYGAKDFHKIRQEVYDYLVEIGQPKALFRQAITTLVAHIETTLRQNGTTDQKEIDGKTAKFKKAYQRDIAKRRMFPKSVDWTKIRKMCYDDVAKKDWKKAKTALKGEKKTLVKRVKKINADYRRGKKTKNVALLKAANQAWQAMIKEGTLSDLDSIGRMPIWDLDHRMPVTYLWNTGFEGTAGNNSTEKERKRQYANTKNLRWVSKSRNVKKSNRDEAGIRHTAVLWVGTRFTSKKWKITPKNPDYVGKEKFIPLGKIKKKKAKAKAK